MKILLVDNSTRHLEKLSQALAGHDVERQVYKPGISFHTEDKDLIILSGGGGEGKEIHDYQEPNRLWYEDEVRFVQNCTKPIIGICMGFEVIATAFGANVEKMDKSIDNFAESKATRKGKKVLGSKILNQFESHDWCVAKVPKKHFEVLAKSNTGIEAFRHKKRPILATQFHPEIPGGTVHLRQLLAVY